MRLWVKVKCETCGHKDRVLVGKEKPPPPCPECDGKFKIEKE